MAGGWDYRGQLGTKPSLKLNLDSMDGDATMAYTLAFADTTRKLADFCRDFPYKRAREAGAWGLPLPVLNRAVELYANEEPRSLDGLPSNCTKDQRDDWCLQVFAMALERATREALRGEIDLPRGQEDRPMGAPSYKDKDHPVGVLDDPKTWQVCPEAQTLRKDYSFKADFYGFDAKLNKVICELNTKNMNIFLNSFNMDGRDWERGSDPSAKAFGLVIKKLMGVGRPAGEGPNVRNPGARWWRDPNATRDRDLILYKGHRESMGRPRSPRSKSPDRGRSRTARGDRGRGSRDTYSAEEDATILETLDTAREDYSWTETTPQSTIDSWTKAVVRMHKARTLRDPTDFDKPGTAPHGMNFLKGTTYINLVQFIKLNKVHTRLADLWLRTVENRVATTTLNGVLGDDLRNLIEHYDSVKLTDEEEDRVIALHNSRPLETRARICGFWKRRNCREGDACHFIHG